MKLKPSLDWLLIFVPLAILLRFWPGGISPTALFVCSALGIIPVAGWIGRATEALAARVGEGLGGLLNATFGNAAELIIAGIALSKGLTDVVKASITGSIIGNVLLVLGLSILMGGTKYKKQCFNRTAASSSVISLSLAAIGSHHSDGLSSRRRPQPRRLEPAGRAEALVRHRRRDVPDLLLHARRSRSGPTRISSEALRTRRKEEAMVAQKSYYHPAHRYRLCRPALGVSRRDDRKHADSVGLTEVFVGVIVVAIVGNAAEHSTAILMAMKNKMDLSIGIAIGSSLQIALFVAPVLIFLSYFFGRPMDLEFTLPEVFAVVVSVYILFQISSDGGETNWIEGVQLLSVYLNSRDSLFLSSRAGTHRTLGFPRDSREPRRLLMCAF